MPWHSEDKYLFISRSFFHFVIIQTPAIDKWFDLLNMLLGK
jgi:hypothetical protein